MDKDEHFSTDESADEEEIFRDFDAEAQLIIREDLLPKKSADRYLLVYNNYKKWEADHQNVLSSSKENNLIVYFKDLKSKLKPPSLWSVWSMLKKTLSTHDGVDISRFLNLKSLLTNNGKGYKPKKSAILKWNEVEKFLRDATDHVYLASKVILVLGVSGALRCDELTNLKMEDVEDLGNKFIVSVKDTKTHLDRQFVVGSKFYKTVKQYVDLRPHDNCPDRFLINYYKGKCTRQVIGKNKIGEVPKQIASFLELPEPKTYTGHCFRRTAATLLSDSGASLQMVKQLGGWKSDKVALGYVENSMFVRENIFRGIVHGSSTAEPRNPQPLTSAAATDPPPSVSAHATDSSSSTSALPKNALSSATLDAELNIEWNDFAEDFSIDAIPSAAPSPEFATAAGTGIKISEKQLSTVSNLEVQNPQKHVPSISSSKPPSSGFNSAITATKRHFLEKEPLKVMFANSSEPVQKKRIIDSSRGKAYAGSSLKISNNDTLDVGLGERFQNCIFNNCTFNILPEKY